MKIKKTEPKTDNQSGASTAARKEVKIEQKE